MIRRPPIRLLLAGGTGVLLVPVAVGDRFWLQFLGQAMVTSIFAMSLDMLVGYVGLVSLAHAAFYGLAAYLLAGASNYLGLVSPLVTLPACLAGTAVVALVIGWLSLRAKGIYFIMVTLAFTEMLHYFFSDAPWFGGSDGLYIARRPELGLLDFADRTTAYLAIWLALILVYLFLQRMLRAPFGVVLIGIRSNEQRMRSLGFPTPRYKLVAFAVAGTVAGLAGYLDATLYGFVNPEELGWRKAGHLLMVVLLGGKGTLYGPAIAALFLAFLERYGERLTPHWNAMIGAFVLLVVLHLPRGLVGGLGGTRGPAGA
jgi:branched-chain amino acid transport system permease protein